MQSVNSPCIRLADRVGVSKVKQTLQRCGIYTQQPDNLTIALGTGGVVLIDFTAAYATFFNGGCLVNPYGILMIKSRSGKIIYQHKKYKADKVISDAAYQKIRKCLHSTVLYGTGRRAAIGSTVYGKTGSNGDIDAWFIGGREYVSGDNNTGFTGVVVGVWVGNDKNQPMHKSSMGSRLPAQITKSFLLGG